MKNESFYEYAIHVIYVIILTRSFDISTKVFIPLQEVNTPESLWTLVVNSLAIILTQFVMISGWVNYTKSIRSHPHKLNIYGNSRFVTDLIITFVMFYFIVITDKENFAKNFWQAFVWVLPVLFGLFMVWDYLKSKEYASGFHENEDENRFEMNQRWKTVFAFGFLVFMLITFLILNDIYTKANANIITLYLIYIMGMFILNLYYRIWKRGVSWFRIGWTITKDN